MPTRDAFCNSCGTKYPLPLAYPRTCTSCKQMVWANPIPVGVGLVPVQVGERTGLLVIRRAIPPGVGKLALVGGFVEEHESWQRGLAREVHEEANVVVDPARVEPLWFVSSEPKPNRVLLFGITEPIAKLPPFEADGETSERGVIFGPEGLDPIFAFPLHAEAARRYFAARKISGPNAFTSI
ncbi:MAG: NUDIX domain-containing protein [Deltaproteobacteria bacterium]|nr:NUDIX domain-containing protein [Deltaproteobacteria bacterium]